MLPILAKLFANVFTLICAAVSPYSLFSGTSFIRASMSSSSSICLSDGRISAHSCSVLSSTAISQQLEPQAPPLSLVEASHWTTQFYKSVSDWSAGLAIRLIDDTILGLIHVHMQLPHFANWNCSGWCRTIAEEICGTTALTTFSEHFLKT